MNDPHNAFWKYGQEAAANLVNAALELCTEGASDEVAPAVDGVIEGEEAGSTAAAWGPRVEGGSHNDTIARRIDEIKTEHPDWEHTYGGSKAEEYIKTPKSTKVARRPDITFARPGEGPYREQVGRVNASSQPVTRERNALDDL
jgi:hypothetical protein